MALDGVTLAYLVNELAPRLKGARIDKIFQPEKDEVHIQLRLSQGNRRLLLNAGATSPRFILTDETKKNPQTPPMFCMILRKHLEGGKILAILQKELERVVTFEIQNYNDRGDLVTLHLHLEIMGKHSNLILVDPETNTIFDGLKRYSHAVSRHREVLPGRTYLAPPSQGKLPPLSEEETWREVLLNDDLDGKLSKLLLKHFAGISPELALEILIRAGLDPEVRLQQCGDIDLSRLFQAYRLLAAPQVNQAGQAPQANQANPTDQVAGATQPAQPCLYYAKRPPAAPLAFSFLPFQQYQDLFCEQVPSLNEAVERFYRVKATQNSLEAKRGSLRKIVQEHQTHVRKKLQVYEETMAEAEANLAYQKWGELLTANLHRVPDTAAEVTLEDYYDPELAAVTIPLDPQLRPNENAQRYYRLYNKAKATLLKMNEFKETAEMETAYLDTLLLSIDQAASDSELAEIQLELTEQGYLAGKHLNSLKGKAGRGGSKSKGKAKTKEFSRPRVFHSSSDKLIYVGKNNAQNDWLSLRKGKPQDLWLHVKQIPGSHVLVPLTDGEEFPDDTTLEEAAALAVYYSQARGSSQVAVDYTHVKQLKKPNAAKPGMVIYEQNWTLYLTPKPEILENLLAGESEAAD